MKNYECCMSCEKRMPGCQSGCEDFAVISIMNTIQKAKITQGRNKDIDARVRLENSIAKRKRRTYSGSRTKYNVGQR